MQLALNGRSVFAYAAGHELDPAKRTIVFAHVPFEKMRGGQPLGADLDAVRARMQALYRIDQDGEVRVSHRNPWVTKLYDEFLGKPLGETSHKLLHTRYGKREVPL